MKNIILLAPPAAGKGTQSTLLKNSYNLVHISTGDLLREKLNENSELSLKIKTCMNTGNLVSDNIIVELIKDKILKEKSSNGYIFDGFPRNINQAQLLKNLLNEINQNINYVIYLDVNKEELKKRVVGRLSCPVCKTVYNDQIEGMIPLESGICDNCKNHLVKREDDNEETFEKRYQTYMMETEPLIKFYSEENLLYKINSLGTVQDIFNEIKAVIDSKC